MSAPLDPAARRLPDILAEAAALCATWYAGYRFIWIGIPPDGNEHFVVRIPSPQAVTPAVVDRPDSDDNASLIMQAVNEADGPRTAREIFAAATGDAGDPPGAFRRAIRRLVDAGRLRELTGPPRAYDLP